MNIIEQFKNEAIINEFGSVISGCVELVDKICNEIGVPDKKSIINVVKKMKKVHPRILDRLEILKTIQNKNEYNKRLYKKIKVYADKCLKEPLLTLKDSKSKLLFVRDILDRVFVFGFMHINEGDEYADFLKLQLIEALNLYRTFNLENSDDVLECSELTVALCVAYDWLYDSLNDDEKLAIRESIKVHAKTSLEFYNPPYTNNATQVNNWNSVFSGSNIVAGLTMYGEDDSDVWENLICGAIRSITLPISEFCPNGGFPEGVGYWQYQVQYIVYALASLNNCLGTDFNLSKMPGMEKTGLFPIYLHNNNFFPFNFSDAGTYPAVTAFMNWFGSRFDLPEVFSYNDAVNPEGVNYNHWVGAHYDIITMLWRDDSPSDSYKLLPKSCIYKGRQQVMTIRNSWDENGIFIGFKGGYNQLPHCNLDIGTFVYDRYGIRWFTEIEGEDYSSGGYWDFKSGRWKYYSQRAEGHNTIVVNPSENPDQDIYATSEVDMISCNSGTIDITKAYPCLEKGSRTFMLDGETTSIKDELHFKQKSDVYWFFHTIADVDIISENTVSLSLDGKRIKVSFDMPYGAEIKCMDAKSMKLPQSTNHTQTEGIRKLCVKISGVKDVTLVTTIS